MAETIDYATPLQATSPSPIYGWISLGLFFLAISVVFIVAVYGIEAAHARPKTPQTVRQVQICNVVGTFGPLAIFIVGMVFGIRDWRRRGKFMLKSGIGVVLNALGAVLIVGLLVQVWTG